MSASLGLFRLQQVDRLIDRAQTRLEVIRKTLENDAELKSALTRMENAQSAHHLALHELKFAENEVETQKIKIEQTESSLYGGSVKNPKELQDLQKDVESLKKHLTTLEERQLEAMFKVEAAAAELKSAQGDLESIQTRLGSEHSSLIEERSSFTRQLESLAEEREAAITPISSDLLHVYEDLRRQKRGVAVAEVEDGACAACGTNINASVQQNARSQKTLIHCPSCGRILFAN